MILLLQIAVAVVQLVDPQLTQSHCMLQGQHRSLKEKLLHSKQDSNELREEVASLYRLKDRQRTLELQLKVSHT